MIPKNLYENISTSQLTIHCSNRVNDDDPENDPNDFLPSTPLPKPDTPTSIKQLVINVYHETNEMQYISNLVPRGIPVVLQFMCQSIDTDFSLQETDRRDADAASSRTCAGMPVVTRHVDYTGQF